MLAMNRAIMHPARAALSFAAFCLAAGTTGTFEVSLPAGIAFKHENSPTPRKHLIEAMGGGVALFDYNNDGLLDVFFVNSGQLNAAQQNSTFARANERNWNRLYRQ